MGLHPKIDCEDPPPADTPPFRRLRPWLAHRRMPLFIAGVAVLLALPSLWGGWIIDDYHQQLRLRHPPPFERLSETSLDLFDFAGGDPGQTRWMMDLGIWPWWTLPELRAAFFRPISSATHWLDDRLWHDSAALMHAQSIAWFAALAAAAAVFYRRLLGWTWVAGLAALLYAVDDARALPVGFLSNRNALIATLFGLLAVIAHDRWRRDGRAWAAVLAPVWLAAALLSAEAGIGATAYLFAYAVFLDRGSWPRRLATLLPHAAVVIVWRIVWSQLGYGVHGICLYVDPLVEPLRFLFAVIVRAPILLLGQWLLPPSDLALLAADYHRLALYWILAVALLVPVAWFIRSRVDWTPRARFFALGMALAVLPTCATFPSDRMLVFVGLGAFGLLALALSSARPVPWSRVAAGVLIAVHLVLAPIVLAVHAAMPVGPKSFTEMIQVHLPDDPAIADQSVVVVTAPLPVLACYLPERRALAGLPVPAHTRVLAPSGPGEVTVRRLDARTLAIRPAEGFMRLLADRLARNLHHPMSVGQRVRLTGMTVEVLELTSDGRPAEATFRFDVPLDDPSLRWLCWRYPEFVPFVPPPVGTTVHLTSQSATESVEATFGPGGERAVSP